MNTFRVVGNASIICVFHIQKSVATTYIYCVCISGVIPVRIVDETRNIILEIPKSEDTGLFLSELKRACEGKTYFLFANINSYALLP